MSQILTQLDKILQGSKEISKKTYLWIEDREGKSGHTFWKVFMREVCPDVIVESKKNNSELVKAVKGLTDNENRYIIVFDKAFDNSTVRQEQERLEEAVESRRNVFILDIICFEYILLDFDKLIDWVYATEDDLREKRACAIAAREQLIQSIRVGEINYRELSEVKKYNGSRKIESIEKFSARLLRSLTENTGFEVSKSSIGVCWQRDCCDWKDRGEDDICGLDLSRLSLKEKMRSVLVGTSLYSEFKNIGLEVLS